MTAEREGACQHKDTSFDRSVCACGSMHDYCNDCGRAIDCPLDERREDDARDRLVQGAAALGGGAPRSAPGGRDLEWEVTHKKSKIHKGRGATPEEALVDLRNGFVLGVADAQENLEREQKRLDKLNALIGDAEDALEHG